MLAMVLWATGRARVRMRVFHLSLAVMESYLRDVHPFSAVAEEFWGRRIGERSRGRSRGQGRTHHAQGAPQSETDAMGTR